tara:strand:+ start:185 stop:973 length:789 start_codon:yes stop_codon:yes gene_type:complete
VIDIGANLTHKSFDHDMDDVIKRSLNAGVEKIIVTASSIEDTKKAIELTEQYSNTLWATAGVHPHNAKDAEEQTGVKLKQLLTQQKIVAIGEIGLDYCRNFSEPNEQKQIFKIQLDIAAETSLPVFLHQRDSHHDFVAILKDYKSYSIGGVAHCFTEGNKELKDYLDLGLYIGITGWLCDPRRNKNLIDAMQYIPIDRLLIETDAPYLMPKALEKGLKTRRNEPCFLPHVAQAVAEYKKIDLGEVVLKTSQNAERLFFKQKQ